MWNTNYSWAPWHNDDSNYKPQKRRREVKNKGRGPYDLYNNFVTAGQSATAPIRVPLLSQSSLEYNRYYDFGDTWRSSSVPPKPPPLLPRLNVNKADYWTPRAVAPRLTNPHYELWNDFDAPAKPLPIKFLIWKSAKECGVKWTIPIDIEERKKMDHTLKVYDGDQLLESSTPSVDETEFRWSTTPGNLYMAEMRVKNKRGIEVAYGVIKFKAIFSIYEMKMLMERALEFCTNKPAMHPFTHVYRCKPSIYWRDIEHRTNRIMIKYIKDENGQAASPINGVIYGLFFSARLLMSGMLPQSSPFGDVRMVMPAALLLDPDLYNLYFSDFYCNKLTHYVTIVICKKDSDTDRYCKQKLILLRPENAFVRVIRSIHGFEFFINKKVWVELYYTENVPLSWGRFDKIHATGLGTSRIGGLPHNKKCTICNLYPISTGKYNEEEMSQYEEGEDEIIASQGLEGKVDEMKYIGLSSEDCKDIVFLVGNLVDRVTYELEDKNIEITDDKDGENDDKMNVKDAYELLHNPELGNGPFKPIIDELKDMQSTITRKIDDMRSAIKLKKRELDETVDLNTKRSRMN